MTTLAELIERLEKAEGPSRELDADIAVELGLVASREWWSTDYIKNGMIHNFTGSLDAAVALAERVLPGVNYTMKNLFGAFDAAVTADHVCGVHRAEHPVSLAIALVLATLKALEATRT